MGFWDQFLRDNECSETVTGQVLAELLAGGSLTGLDFRGHNNISAFNVENDLAALFVSHNDTHALRLRAEREVLEDLVVLLHSIWVGQEDDLLVAHFKFHIELFSKLDQGDLVRTRCLELFLGLIIGIWVHWSHIVAQ